MNGDTSMAPNWRPSPPVSALTAHHHQGSAVGKQLAELPNRPIAPDVEHHLEARLEVAERSLGVIQHLVGSQRLYELELGTAAHTRDRGPESFGELHRKAAEVASTMMVQMPAGEFPYLSEMFLEHVLQPGYAYADEFEVGLELVLNSLERLRDAH